MESEEAEILRTMINDRDQRIATIKRKQEEEKKKEMRLLQELDDVNMETNRLKIEHQTSKTRLLHAHQTATSKLQGVQRDLQHQSNSLTNFADVVSQQKNIDASDAKFVMRMQAQLCKAMHSMGILDHQMEVVKEQSEDLVKLQKDAVAATTQEKAQLEMSLLNDLMKTDTEKREIESRLGGELDDIFKEISAINEQLDDSDSETDEADAEEEEPEELDEEEKAAKEEAFKLLQSHREKIEALEAENEEKAEIIEELQAQLAEFGPDDAGPTSPTPLPVPGSSLVAREEKPAEPEVDPNDIMAVAAARARAAQSDDDDSDVEEIDELDLLKLAQSRMNGPPAEQEKANDGKVDDDESEDSDDYEESFDATEISDDDDIVEGPLPTDIASPEVSADSITSVEGQMKPDQSQEDTNEVLMEKNGDATASEATEVIDSDEGQ